MRLPLPGPRVPPLRDLLSGVLALGLFVPLVMLRDSPVLLDLNQRLFGSAPNIVSFFLCVASSVVVLLLSKTISGLQGTALNVRSLPATLTPVLLALVITVVPVFENTIDQLARWASLWIRYTNVATIEEILFRAILFELLRRSVGTGWGIVLSSVLFALGHYVFIAFGASIDLSLPDFLLKTVAGSVLCLYYLDFGLLPVIVLHASTDVLGNSVGFEKQLLSLVLFLVLGTISAVNRFVRRRPRTR